MLNAICGIKSTGRICTDLAEMLKTNNHEALIAYGREYVPEKYKSLSYRIGNPIDVTLHGFHSLFFNRHGFASKKATENFIKKLISYNPDIIHLHNIHGYYLNIKVLFEYLKKAEKPVLWTLHDSWTMTGHCPNFAAAGCNKWLSGCYDCELIHGYPFSLLADRSTLNWLEKRQLFNGVKNLLLVTPSEWLAGIVKKSYLASYNVKVINNGIDTSIFHPRKSDFREKYALKDKKVILGVSSFWSKNKGFFDFIKLSEMIDSSKYKIVMVGLNKSYMDKLPSNILGLPHTDNPESLAEIYSAADVFFNPTYQDVYSCINMEAQSCGLPVIVYNTGGAAETVPPANLVEQGDLNAVVHKIEKGTLKIKQQDFSKQKMYSKYLEAYKEIVNKA